MKYYLAIDIGASSGRHILGHIDNGILKTEEIYRFDNGMDSKDGSLVWDIDKLYRNILDGIKQCAKIGKTPYSIAIDTWGVDYVLLDDKDQVISPAYAYRDNRTQKYLDTAVPFDELFSRTGIQLQPYNTIYQLLADKGTDRLQNSCSMLMIPEYFSYLLTGVKAHEYTAVSTTGLLNAHAREWDYEIINRLGLPKELFGKIYRPGHILGALSPSVVKEVGFDSLVILPAMHDTGSAVVSVPKQDCIYISSGTWSLMGVESDQPRTTKPEYNLTNEGGAFGHIRLLKNIMGLWLIQQVRKELNNKYSFAELVELAREIDEPPIYIDVNRSEFLSPQSMITAIQSECKRVGARVPTTAGELANTVFNSLAKCYIQAITELESVTERTYATICIIGGGAKNEYLNECLSNLTDKTVYAGPYEATAIGNLILQLYSDGSITNQNQIKTLINKSFEVKEIKKCTT